MDACVYEEHQYCPFRNPSNPSQCLWTVQRERRQEAYVICLVSNGLLEIWVVVGGRCSIGKQKLQASEIFRNQGYRLANTRSGSRAREHAVTDKPCSRTPSLGTPQGIQLSSPAIVSEQFSHNHAVYLSDLWGVYEVQTSARRGTRTEHCIGLGFYTLLV